MDLQRGRFGFSFFLSLFCCVILSVYSTLSQVLTIQLSPSGSTLNDSPCVSADNDGGVWVVFISHGTGVIAGKITSGKWQELFSGMPPGGLLDSLRISATVDESKGLWLGYVNSSDSSVISYYDGIWHVVERAATDFDGSWYEKIPPRLIRNFGAGVWYVMRFTSSPVNATYASAGMSLYTRKVLDKPQGVPMLHWPDKVTFGSLPLDSVVAVYGTLGSSFHNTGYENYTSSLVEYSRSGRVLTLEQGLFSVWFGYGASGYETSPIGAGNDGRRVLVVTRYGDFPFPPWRCNAYLIGSDGVTGWKSFITNTSGAPLAVSANASTIGVAWVSGNAIGVKALSDDTWYDTTFVDTLSQLPRKVFGVSVTKDKSVWVAYTAMKDGGRHVFISRVRLMPGDYPADTAPTVPHTAILFQNYPNPFNPATTIRYSVPQLSHVTLKVFNTLGQEIKILVDDVKDGGYHEVGFDGSGFASGIYLYRLQTGDFAATKKFVLMK
jgi:hypothetical protein